MTVVVDGALLGLGLGLGLGSGYGVGLGLGLGLGLEHHILTVGHDEGGVMVDAQRALLGDTGRYGEIWGGASSSCCSSSVRQTK